VKPLRAALVVATCWIACSTPMFAYLKFGLDINGQNVTLKWKTLPVRYFVSSRGPVAGVSIDDFDRAITRAFATWEAVPSSAIRFERVGLTSASPRDDDGMTVLGFEDHPELDRVLGQTSFTFDIERGEIVEADIFFNRAFPWSVASGGTSGRFDLESIALHEIGHLTGLGHSALGETEQVAGGGRRVIAAEAVMFPIAFSPGNTSGRTLRADDVAGVSDLYPDGAFNRDTGSVSGRVTKNGKGVFGAHIVAFNLQTRSLIASFTLNENGDYAIAGLDPGPTIVRVEPLDDGDIDSFFNDAAPVDLDFGVTYHDRLAVVPRGGNAAGIDVTVRSK
jgi:hypothetical protein